jgi:hypothetical protein
MMSSLGPFLVVVAVLSWVVVPMVVVVALAVGPRLLRPEPLLVRRCRRPDPSDPASRPCWVPVGEHCPRHGGLAQDALAGREPEPVIA